MSLVIPSRQMRAAERQYAEEQLSKAARDLHDRAHADYTRAQIEQALSGIAGQALPLGIKRIKWLKILTLWHLYPAAAPDPEALGAVLHDQDKSQDARMRAALALPTGTDHRE